MRKATEHIRISPENKAWLESLMKGKMSYDDVLDSIRKELADANTKVADYERLKKEVVRLQEEAQRGGRPKMEQVWIP